MRSALLIPTLVLAGLPALRADGLSDLKAALRALPAREVVRARVEQDGLEREGKTETRSHRVTTVEDGPGGLKILQDEGAPAPTGGRGSRKGGAPEGGFRQQVRAQEELLETLDKARLLDERTDTFEGRPARRLRLALDTGMDEDARKHVQSLDQSFVIWLDPQSLPLAMDLRMEVRARAMLFFKVWTRIQIHRRFQKIKDRLVALDERAEVQGEALGKAFGGSDSTRCSVLP